MLRAVLFDLGDTLVDFEPMDTRAVFREAARAVGAPEIVFGLWLTPPKAGVSLGFT